jgi:hypothetical protein
MLPCVVCPIKNEVSFIHTCVIGAFREYHNDTINSRGAKIFSQKPVIPCCAGDYWWGSNFVFAGDKHAYQRGGEKKATRCSG